MTAQKKVKRLLFLLFLLVLWVDFSLKRENLPIMKKSSQKSTKRSSALDRFPLSCEAANVRSDMETIAFQLEPTSYIENDKRKPLRPAVVNIIGCLDTNVSGCVSLDNLLLNFDSLDVFFLNPFRLTYVFLYDFPDLSQKSAELDLIFKKSLQWKKTIERNEKELIADGEWHSKIGTRILVKGRRFELPLYIQREPEILRDTSWLGCVGIRRSLDYNLYSGAVFSHHIFFEPLFDEFDYVFKVDLDIQFLKQTPYSPASLMREKNCIFLHSEIKAENIDCNKGVFQATTYFAKILGKIPSSSAYEWCSIPFYFYGNFVGFNLEFYSSPTQQYFSRWLYECVKDGYFRYRWTDQAPYPMYLCLSRDIPDIKNSTDICSLESWRGSIFQHVQGD